MHAIGSALVTQGAQHLAQGLGYGVNQGAGPKDDVKAQVFQILAGEVRRATALNHIREHIGYVFQDSDSQLFMTTVEEDIAFGPQNYGLSPEEVEKRVAHALELTHIEDLRKKQIYKLSGGEKKLAAIATILSMEPDIVLMDEPSVALDPKNRRHLINLLNEMEPMKIIASHDLDFILDTCERTILMWEGEIIADGPTSEILTNEELLDSHGLELPLRYYKGQKLTIY